MRRTLPLIRVDAGWLFLLAGLSLVLAAAVIPSGRERHALEAQRAELEHQERANFAVLGAYARFVQDLEERDPALLRRLAAAQLNMMPRGETPLLMASTVNSSVSEWVESTVELPPLQSSPVPDTLLARWTDGSKRLWAIGAGAFMVFIGLMISPTALRSGRPGDDPASIVSERTESEGIESAESESISEPSNEEETERFGSPSERAVSVAACRGRRGKCRIRCFE